MSNERFKAGQEELCGSTRSICASVQMKHLILIGGGTRGLGHAVKERYREKGFKIHLLQRQLDYEPKENEYLYEFDLVNGNWSERLEQHIGEITKKYIGSNFISHCLTGGSLGIQFSDAENSDISNVFLHNCILPIHATQLINKYALQNPGIDYQMYFYSSAVSKNLTSTPFYNSSKSALETFYKSFIRIKPQNLFTCLLRLGPVDIDHKYFHKLSLEDPEKLENIIKRSVPTMHLTKTNEIAEFVDYTSFHKGFFDGMIADLTGGSAWTN